MDEDVIYLEAKLADPNTKLVEMRVQDTDPFNTRWPDIVTVSKPFNGWANGTKKCYIPKLEAIAEITMLADSDCAIGSCRCSNCKEIIEPYFRYCPNCGAILKEKQVIGED